MLIAMHSRKSPTILPRRHMRVRRGYQAYAFGNALGNSIAAGLSKPSQQESKVSRVNLNRAQEERLQSGQTVTDYGDGYAEGSGDTASSVGAQRRAGGAAGEVAALTIDQVAAMNPDGSRAAGAGRGFVNPPTVGEMESMRENSGSTGILNPNATDRLQSIQGLDIDIGIKRVRRNVNGYQRMLVALLSSHAQEVHQLRQALASDDRPLMKEVAHSLKGSIGNIGAMTLAKAATELDVALHQNASFSQVETSGAIVIEQLTDLVDGLRNALCIV
jgi:HPt (histidine-containing phosphotransfer) domain-containing protein